MNRTRSTMLIPVLLIITSAAGCCPFKHFAKHDKPDQPGQPAQPAEVAMLNEWKGYNSGYADKQRMTVEDARLWQTVWNTVHATRSPVPPLPEVDFSKQIVVAALMGQKNTGGYEVRITRIVRTPKGVEVYVRETNPPADAMVTQALTQPYHLVLIPKPDAPVTFVDDQ